MPTSIYPYNKTGPDMDPPIPWNPCRYNRSLIVSGTDGSWLLQGCSFSRRPHLVPASDFLFNASTGGAPDEDQMAAFVAHNGPTQAGINANVFSYLSQDCGADDSCFVTQAMCDKVKGQPIDHSILLVGFGKDKALGDYWTVSRG